MAVNEILRPPPYHSRAAPTAHDSRLLPMAAAALSRQTGSNRGGPPPCQQQGCCAPETTITYSYFYSKNGEESYRGCQGIYLLSGERFIVMPTRRPIIISYFSKRE